MGGISGWDRARRARAAAPTMRRAVIVLLILLASAATTASAATPVDPLEEARNYAIARERGAAWGSPSMTVRVARATADYQRARRDLLRSDPERAPDPNPCTIAICAPDPRLQDWAGHGGIVEPVLFTARSGATLSGHVWATRAGAARRPGVVIVNGSIVGYEEAWWYAAQALAASGYVVLTFDVQGEGMSDQFGDAPDRDEGAFAGTPVVGRGSGPGFGGSGLPFYDGGADALDFFLSTPDRAYTPVASRTSGTSHADKQRRRAAAGLNPSHNPLWRMLDPNAIGIAGHSYGAQAASWLAQQDPRLKAGVAWDTLCIPVWPSPDEADSIAGNPDNRIGGVLPGGAPYAFAPECFGAPEGPAPPLTKPVLGLAGDYLLDYAPYVTRPDPLAKARASLAYAGAGVDGGQIVIRGGTHVEFADEPTGGTGASLRGIDLTTWFTTAWFDKYLKRDPRADARLLSARWRDDRAGGAVDPSGDANLYSFYYRSRLDITLAGGSRYTCENLRDGCPGQPAIEADCGPRDYSFLAVDTAATAPVTCTPCRAHATVRRRALIASPRELAIRGRAWVSCDAGATLAPPRVRRVDVAIARRSRGRCAFLTDAGRLARPRSCRRPIPLPARGTTAWRFSTTAQLPRGHYRIYALATDQDGRRSLSAHPGARFRIR